MVHLPLVGDNPPPGQIGICTLAYNIATSVPRYRKLHLPHLIGQLTS